MNTRWEVREPWTLLSRSIHLRRAPSHSSWAGRDLPEQWPLSFQVPARPQVRTACYPGQQVASRKTGGQCGLKFHRGHPRAPLPRPRVQQTRRPLTASHIPAQPLAESAKQIICFSQNIAAC